MDALHTVRPYKDTTVALMLEAQRRGYRVGACEPGALWLDGHVPWAEVQWLRLADVDEGWYEVIGDDRRRLTDFDRVLMRKDPPFDSRYLNATYMLELAERLGVQVCNRPRALRDANEKLAALWFPDWIPETRVSARPGLLRDFVAATGRVVVKPLDGMGGRSIFMTGPDDPNLNVILETLTAEGRQAVMAQRYLPAIRDGDIRVLLVDGQPVPYVLARIPGEQDFRGNLARGGRGEPRPINDDERAIAAAVGPELRRRGIWLAGIDVIGDRLTEVNVTSPTCVRELERAFGINICAGLFDVLEGLRQNA
jgi:glutathione synthase